MYSLIGHGYAVYLLYCILLASGFYVVLANHCIVGPVLVLVLILVDTLYLWYMYLLFLVGMVLMS